MMKAQISWGRRLSKAIIAARAEKKLILIDFFRPNCEACMRMENETFLDKALIEYINKNFVSLKFKSGVDAEQFYRFDINSEPTFLVLDAEGEEIYRKTGYFEPGLLIKQLEKAKKKAARRNLR